MPATIKISPEFNLSIAMEMAFDLDLDHFLEVEEKIEQVLNENQFDSLLNGDDTVEMCTSCQCDPCDCDWGSHE